MKWLIDCLRCGHSWYIETQHMENGLPPAQSVKCPNCHDDTLMYKKCELLKDSPQKKGMDKTNISTPRTDSSTTANTTRDPEKWIVRIPRDAVEHSSDVNRHVLENIVVGIASMCVKEGKLRKITLTISGYDSDPRELYEIPEVCAWARDTFKSLPSLWFFLENHSRDAFIGWLCGPVARKGIQSRDFLQRLNNMRMECAGASIAASSSFLEKAGASKAMVSTFYLQEVNNLAAAKVKQNKWWQFWK